jgi:hypothetical protein
VRELACERCGRSFGCGVDDGACWCAEVELDEAARARLAAAADDCLCPACLAEAAAVPAEARLDLVQTPPEAAGALDVRTQRPHAPGQLGV